MKVIFETPRLVLGQFTENDSSLILNLNSHPGVVKYVHEPVLETEEKAREILLNIILPQYKMHLGRWAIYTKESNEFIGWCGLKYQRETEEIDLGYRLHPASWGKGYATEAAQHTLAYGLNQLAIPVITGRAHVENIASLKVLEKIGMKWTRNELIDGCSVKTYIALNTSEQLQHKPKTYSIIK